ncbi:type I restriction-modification protein subunit S [Methylophaga thalassica]|uniref:Type I restriction-modification protein subunit S n=1 Tax=Methylophaga thalassica TaxID=40223 RepID=A0ABQ5TWD4_9GAMM|nr:restriction endonuclease subunit S [Methylophaga thalassica]GLQ00106.1 type I restriction-modification protein subunit S [Methylophaga thalassica]
MKYAKYPSYKIPNVEWLDTQPEQWSDGSLRWFAKIYAGGTPSKTNEAYWQNGTIPWLNSGSVNQSLITQASAFITNDAYANSSAKWIPAGSLVIALAGQGKTKGMVAQLSIEATCNQSMAAIVPNSNLEPRFLYWWLNSNYQNIRNMAGGDLRDGLNLEMVASIQCPIPSSSEQIQIAAFLDRETAKIDRLIEKQQRLIELLEEKRQAAISNAVTKGLNPDAPMKVSGVEWLGEIPSHWEVKQLKRLIKALESGVSVNATDVPATASEYGVLKTSCVYTRFFRPEENKTVFEEELDRLKCPVRAGSIIISRMNTPDLVGASAFVELDHENLFLPDRLWQTVFDDSVKVNPEYLSYFMMIKSFREQISLYAAGTSSSMQNIAQEDYLSIPVCFPALDEQTQIVEHIKEQLGKLESLGSKANKTVELLRERRTALISAAVTGKIDVRDQVPQDVEKVVAS